MVLCIQQLPDECVIGSDKVCSEWEVRKRKIRLYANIFDRPVCFQISPSAVKDYNRGRLYLADMAKRENVPIYESIQDAIKAAIDKSIG